MKKHGSASSGSFTKPTASLTPTELIRLENFKTLAQMAVGGAATLSQLLGPSEKVITKRSNGLEPIEGPFAFVIEDELKLPANWLSSSKKTDRDIPAESLKILGMTAEQVQEHVYGAYVAPPAPAVPKKQIQSSVQPVAAVEPVAKAEQTPAQDVAVVRVSRKPGKKPLLSNAPTTSPAAVANQINTETEPTSVAVSNEEIKIQSFKEAPVAQNKNDQQTTSFNHISNFSMLCDGRSHKKRVAELSGCTPGNVTQILSSESVRPDRMAEIERRLCLSPGTLAKNRFNSLNELPQLSVDIFQGKVTTEEGYALLSKQENKTVVKVAEKPTEQPKLETPNEVVEKPARAKKAKGAEPVLKSALSQPEKLLPEPVAASPVAPSLPAAPPASESKNIDQGLRAQQIAEAMVFAQTATHEDVTRLLSAQFNDLKPMVSLAVSAVVGRALTGNMTEAQALQVYSLFVEKAPVSA